MPMVNYRLAVGACGIALGLAAAAGSVHAWIPESRTTLTFAKAFGLPGVTLAAGTYVFEVANPESGSDVVRVRANDDYRHVYYAGFTHRIDRPAGLPEGRPVIFGEDASGVAPPVL